MLQETEATSPLSTFTTSPNMVGWLWKTLAKFHFRSSSILSGTGRYLFHLRATLTFAIISNFQFPYEYPYGAEGGAAVLGKQIQVKQ